MKHKSSNALIVGTVVLISGITSTAELDAAYLATPTYDQSSRNMSYTAHGKTDRKTARLFQQLMQNNRNLQIHAEVVKQPATNKKLQKSVAVNYTISGKTDMKTVRKLVELFQNSKKIEISAIAKSRSETAVKNPKVDEYKPQNNRNLYNGSASAYAYNNYLPPYYFGHNGNVYSYNGYPPVYVQGNTIWYPVPVINQPTVAEIKPTLSRVVASNQNFSLKPSGLF